jgi:hypothetical protein
MTNYHLRPLTFFASIGRPLERYFTEVIRAQGETIKAELWMEAEERLGQLDFLIHRITELQNRIADAQRRMREAIQLNFDNNSGDKARLFSSPEHAESERLSALRNDLIFELKLLAEAFYYFAARLIKILQHFPHLKNFDPLGVRNVRNHLIEHPDKASSGVTQRKLVLLR